MPPKVQEVMTANPLLLSRDATLIQAARVMRDQAVGDVLVTEDDRLCGVVTDRDIVIRAIAMGRDMQRTTVGEICTPNVIWVHPNDDVDDVVRLMRDRAIRRIPVVESVHAVGIVSIGDLAMERDSTSALADISAAPPNS